MKHFVIGDIHGCFEELQALLDNAALAADDEIIALGDLFDRGPGAAEVFAFFQTQPNARSIMGNHERKHVRAARGELRPALSQRITRWQLGDDYNAALDYMAGLPLYLDLPAALLLHGFFEPGVPLEAQHDSVLTGTLGGENYLKRNDKWPWYVTYDSDKPLVVGHRDYIGQQKPMVYDDRVYGLDTGCVYGGALTGLLLPDFRLISVPCRENYWEQTRSRYVE